VLLTASTLKRPPAKLLGRFKVEDIGNDTVGDFLRLGWSLAICCRACPRLVEWTPAELQDRYPCSASCGRRLSSDNGAGDHKILGWPLNIRAQTQEVVLFAVVPATAKLAARAAQANPEQILLRLC
jgi:hypothetical protein